VKTPRDFCYWLQGCLELNEGKTLSPEQVTKIRTELDKVFTHPNSENKPNYWSGSPFDPLKSQVRC